MKKNTKEWIQYGSAMGLLTSGVLMAFLSFFLHDGEVKDSVLWYVSQTLVYAGSIFGVGIYISNKYGEVRNYIDKVVKGKEENEDEK